MATASSALHSVTKFGAFTPDALTQLLTGYSMGGLFTEFAHTGITAAGNSQATAFQTLGQTIHVSTVSAGTGILLPPGVAGLEVLVINKGVNNLQVYGNGIDTIDDVATATGVSQMPSSNVIYMCVKSAAPGVAATWYSEGLATGFGSSGLQTLSFIDNITAHSGGTQAGGVPITTMISRITTVAVAGDSVTLPASKAGMCLLIVNDAAANAANVFPNAGGTGTEAINAGGANAAFSLTVAAGPTLFYCFTAGLWRTK